jgi:thiosulfate dehydrogenase
MKAFIVGLIIGILLVPVGFYFYARSGDAPIATAAPSLPFERYFAKTALHAKLQKAMPRTVPVAANAATFEAGASVYMHNCAMCHGTLGAGEPSASKGMFPHPPQLLEGIEMVTDDPPGATFWKVQNGIRLSGMPAFRETLSAQQIWQVSVMLANANKLPLPVLQTLSNVPAPAPANAQSTKPAGP